ncbi:MAG TPA: hypothetical protein DCP69_00450 [Candidatus Omnitrophica bacterium]|nr:hypothetical protein [Candidatus Omnitrophota bacterium]
MPLTGDAKREWQRIYDRQRRQQGRIIAKTVKALATDTPLPTVSQEILHAAQGRLQTILTDQGLHADLLVAKVRDKLAASRHQTVAGEAIEADDNDAQLRAVEIGIRLHERAGTIPAPAGGNGGGGTTINVFEVVYAPQIADPRLIPAIDAASDADPRVIDAQVLDSSDDA